ncbi:MAG: ATP-binding cassette domain-containing protein, partial [Lachnospiraceae bacterium]|nr:ATP-binding cassette domain-containing protein [Lachnospiraceae bacterium]
MLKIWKKMMVLLDKKQKRSMVLLVIMMFFGAMLEAFSITLIVPVASLIMDPLAIEESELVSALYQWLPFESPKVFGTAIMVAMIVAFILKNVYLYFMQKFMYHFVYTNQFSTSERMMKNYMRRGYEFYLNADTAVIQRSITSDVNNMYGLILAVLQLLSEIIVFLTLSAVLLVTDPIMTIFIGGLLAVTLLIIKVIYKPIMYKAGKDNQDYYSNLFKWINQTVTGIKEVKIGGREKYFIDTYRGYGKGYVDAVQKYTLYNNIPKLFIETVCICGAVLYFLYLFLTDQSSTEIMEIVAAFGLAVARLMPSANRINNQLNNISFFEPFFMGVSDNLQDEIDNKNTDISFMEVPKEKLPVTKEIALEGVSYKYPNTDKWILKDADVTVPVGKSVGIVGSSGAGKSTIVDVMLGLLVMQEGKITADGQDIFDGENYRKWLKNVGYIPQTIFMIDDT